MIKKNIKLVSLFICIVMVISLLLSGCSSSTADNTQSTPDDSKTYRLRVGSITSARPSVVWDAVDEWADSVKEASNGKVIIETFEGTMGGETEILEKLQMGSFEVYIGSTGVLKAITNDDVFLALDLPYLFESWDHCYNALDGEYGNYINTRLIEAGIRPLGWGSLGARGINYNGNPVISPSDMKNYKMRTMENPIYIDYYTALGAQAVPMAWTEVYTALQMGTVDGSDTTPTAADGSKHQEQAKHYSSTEHVHCLYLIAVSEKWWMSLPSDIQKVIAETGYECGVRMHEIDEEYTEEIFNDWIDTGNEVHEVDKDAFRTVAESIYPKYTELIGKEWIDIIDNTSRYRD